jgi:hypothetical protein
MALNANGVFATSAESADGNAEKSGFPIFPKENPTREQYDLWVLHATNYLNNAGFSALLRGDMLRETTKLADRTRLPVPTDAAAIAAVGAENAKIDSSTLRTRLSASRSSASTRCASTPSSPSRCCPRRSCG